MRQPVKLGDSNFKLVRINVSWFLAPCHGAWKPRPRTLYQVEYPLGLHIICRTRCPFTRSALYQRIHQILYRTPYTSDLKALGSSLSTHFDMDDATKDRIRDAMAEAATGKLSVRKRKERSR
jgi:hypothetical protein